MTEPNPYAFIERRTPEEKAMYRQLVKIGSDRSRPKEQWQGALLEYRLLMGDDWFEYFILEELLMHLENGTMP